MLHAFTFAVTKKKKFEVEVEILKARVTTQSQNEKYMTDRE
jgi:hypothetical protein